MASTHLGALSSRLAERAILKAAKQVMSESDIQPATRRGNKELSFLTKKLAQRTFQSTAEAQQLGETLGQQIVERSQQMGRQHLDQGVILSLMEQPEWNVHQTAPVATQRPSVTTPVAASQSTQSDEGAIASVDAPVELQAVEHSDAELPAEEVAEPEQAEPEAIASNLAESDIDIPDTEISDQVAASPTDADELDVAHSTESTELDGAIDDETDDETDDESLDDPDDDVEADELELDAVAVSSSESDQIDTNEDEV